MRRSVQPNCPRAMTCCFFASLKILAMSAERLTASPPRQRLERLLPMAGFQVSIYGRFWVSTEDEIRKARIASEAVEVGVLLEERVARKSVFCGLLQIPQCQPGLVHAGVGGPDDVRRVVEVLIAFLFRECGSNPFFGVARVSRSGRKQSLQAREQPSSVLRILPHELRDSLLCLGLPPELEQGEGRLKTPERREEALSIANGR